VLKLSHFLENSHSQTNTFQNAHTRPDIVIIDHIQKQVKITEISVPFDCHIDTCYQEKFNKYFPLSMEINSLGYHCEIIVLIMGTLGVTHKKFIPGLIKMNISKAESKFLAKFCSISSIIGSHQVWKERCRNHFTATLH
jgi:hypothetical protein